MQWAVASSFAIPVADAAADCLVDIFSPAAAQEFARVVKPGGAFVFAVPGPRHLYGLKEVLYERPYENTVQDVAYPGFALEQRIPVHSMLTVTGSTILDLFAMTPYYWKTPRSGAERLASLDTLTTELHFDFLVYRRAHASPVPRFAGDFLHILEVRAWPGPCGFQQNKIKCMMQNR